MFRSILFVFMLILLVSVSPIFVFGQPDPLGALFKVRMTDAAPLPFHGAVLYSNTYGKGNITDYQDYQQLVYRDKDDAGWWWDWPKSSGPVLKSHLEVLVGRSPRSEADGLGRAELHAGRQLPRRLAEMRQTIDFDFTTDADGLWLGSFDFWITSSDHPAAKDIVSNLTIWTANHGVANPYIGRHETLEIGGRTYEAIFETPKEQPDKPWKTLCLVDTEPRSKGSLELGPLMDALIAHGLAKPTDFLATAELGNKVAYGKGHTTLRTFRLR
jgi:hypothetical protein